MGYSKTCKACKGSGSKWGWYGYIALFPLHALRKFMDSFYILSWSLLIIFLIMAVTAFLDINNFYTGTFDKDLKYIIGAGLIPACALFLYILRMSTKSRNTSIIALFILIMAGTAASIMSRDLEYTYKLAEDLKLLITVVVVPSIVFILKFSFDYICCTACNGTGESQSLDIQRKKKSKPSKEKEK